VNEATNLERPSEVALALAGINALYGDSHVLPLLGRNGAGKTTCMGAIIGLVPPRDGEIRLFGEPLTGLATEAIARKGVGFVPQGRRVFATLTVRENLVVARQARADAAWTLERVCALFPRLNERLQQPAGSLSGGEQQMLAIGRALMGNPRVLLMDEPSEGLAPLIVAEVRRTIERLKEEGLSILLVEQNLNLALDLADDVVMLNTGRVAFAGGVEQVRNNDTLIMQHLGVY